MLYRILFAVLLLVSVSAFPVLITLCIGIAGLLLYRNFYEIVPLFFIHDAVYGIAQSRFLGIPFAMTILALVLVLVAGFLRTRLFYVQIHSKN